MGPLLFLSYINNLSAVSDITFPIMFADDSNLFIQGKDPIEYKQKHTVHFSKSHNIRTRQNNINIDEKAIETVNYTTFLGVVMDNKLNWSAHIKCICNKMSKSIGIINKVRNLLNKETLIHL